VSTQSQSIGNLALALATAQKEMKNPKRASENPFFKSQYADLASVVNAITPSLAANDLAIMQFVESGSSGEVAVLTMLVHKSGEYVSGTLSAKPAKADPQGIGSTITYLRRYAMLAIVGRAAEDDDDDAEAASDSDNEENKRPAPEDQTQETITEDQATELDALRVEADVSLERFKKFFGITGRPLNSLPVSAYEKAKGMLLDAAKKPSAKKK